MSTKAYLYIWYHTPSGMWYAGSRTKQGCHPDDGYICSSKKVKPLIQSHPHEWSRTVLCVGSAEYIRHLEFLYLTQRQARQDPMSYNQHNCDGRFPVTFGRKMSEDNKEKLRAANKGRVRTPATLAIMSAQRKGKKRGPMSEDHKRKLSEANKGIQWTEEQIAARVRARTYGPLSEEHKQKIAAGNTGKKKGPMTDEAKRKSSESHKGKKHSEETKQKMREARARREALRRVQKSTEDAS